MVFQSFDTADGEIVVAAANDRLFAKLAVALDRPEWARDPRYASNAMRVQHKAVLLPELEAVFGTEPTGHWMARLEAAGVPCAPVNDLAGATGAEQVRALGILQPLPGTGFDIVGLPLSFDGVRPAVRGAAPTLGEHNTWYGLPPTMPRDV